MLAASLAHQVRLIQLRTGRQVADVMAGAYLSVFKGRGMEFEEVRPYVPGDDVRTIDWNVTARTGEPHIKRYVEERELTVLLVVDISPSLDFGSRGRSKREAAVELAALIALSATFSHDKVGLLLFHGAADRYIPPRKGQRHAQLVIREVLARGIGEATPRPQLPRSLRRWFGRLVRQTRAAPDRTTSITAALDTVGKVLSRRAVVFVISDFIDTGYLHALRSANRRHDLVCTLITDAREQTLVPAGLISVADAETGETRMVDTSSPAVQRALADLAGAREQELSASLASAGIDLIRVDATAPVIDPLLAFFRMRERRLRR
ncbi:MAG TPA: DUF58 domain-containing protein [Kofleriaceae bacterium]|nr:DUF58 domain-containing protein [Kofleriaceae bacterium]